VLRLVVEAGGRNGNPLGVRAVPRQTKDLEVGSLRPLVVSPVERGVDDDLSPDECRIDACTCFDNLARAVRPENQRQLDAGVASFADPDVAAVQRRCPEAHDNRLGTGLRVRHLVDLEDVSVAKFAKDDGFHGATGDEITIKPLI
jgi:hypothetical protein